MIYKYDLISISKLKNLISLILQEKNQVTISIVGKKGSGKSTFGRYLRKNSKLLLRTIGGGKISVIDDGVMSVDFLYFFRRKIKFKNIGNVADDLLPFDKWKKKSKVIFYIDSIPTNRLSYADIVVEITVKNEKRLQRLISRNGYEDGLKRYQNSKELFDISTFKHQYFLEIEADEV